MCKDSAVLKSKPIFEFGNSELKTQVFPWIIYNMELLDSVF